MSDLLASLVDRTLDRAPVLQRRQPTLFEPATEAAFNERSQFGNVASVAEEETLVERVSQPERKSGVEGNPAAFRNAPAQLEDTQPPPVEHRPARQRRGPDVNPLQESTQEKAQSESVSHARQTESPASPISPESRPNRGPSPRPIARPEEIIVAPQKLIETIVERRVEREIISEHIVDTSARAEPPGPAGRLTDPRARSHDDKREPAMLALKTEARPPDPPKVEKSLKPITPRKTTPRRDSAPLIRAASRLQSTRAAQPPTPPTVHVSIGRVEVRATPRAAVRPSAAQPAAPKMSLEDYLRSRGEGK